LEKPSSLKRARQSDAPDAGQRSRPRHKRNETREREKYSKCTANRSTGKCVGAEKKSPLHHQSFRRKGYGPAHSKTERENHSLFSFFSISTAFSTRVIRADPR
jgi:hypothetical protein